MKGPQKILILLIVLATGISASCYGSLEMWRWVILISAVGLVWLAGQYYQWRWAGYIGMIFFMVMSARGFLLEIPSLWLLLCTVLALTAWDMNMFLARINFAGLAVKRSYLEKSHFKKLAVTACTGFILGALTLTLDLTIGFGWLILLGIVLILCMSRLIRILTNRG
ncbi:hypothetical protein ACFLZT_06445 [Thermodesulfobacteriota bacterium]